MQVTRIQGKYEVEKGAHSRSRYPPRKMHALLSGDMGKRDKEKALLG